MKRKTSRLPAMMDPKVLMNYDRWVKRHLDELVRKHPGKFIAVQRNKLVAIGDSLKEVTAAAEKGAAPCRRSPCRFQPSKT